MKTIKNILPQSLLSFLLFTFICGFAYTALITGISQVIFPKQANGSITEIDGKKYSTQLMGQQFSANNHMWGRVMNLDVTTYQDKNGDPLMYGVPSNLSPASEEYQQIIAERVAKVKSAHPDMQDTPIPVDLITGSGSGLDPDISLEAAKYQVSRLAAANNISQEAVTDIIDQCTTHSFLGVFGEPTVNVLQVNLILDDILK